MRLPRSPSKPRELPDHRDTGNADNLGAPADGDAGTEQFAHRFIDRGLVLPRSGTETPRSKRPPAPLALVARNALPVVFGDVATPVDIEVHR